MRLMITLQGKELKGTPGLSPGALGLENASQVNTREPG